MNTIDFIRESNRIEGIHRNPTEAEIEEFKRFMCLRRITVNECIAFVNVYQPGARLRVSDWMNVRVGNHKPPRGGLSIIYALQDVLDNLKKHSPYENHVAFEKLHPFMDCNGRLGRMIWMWQKRTAPLGFLHTYYYQSLQESRK